MLEVTLRTPVALACIELIARDVPEAVVGAGTVRTAADVQAVAMAGAKFVVSPGYTHAVGKALPRGRPARCCPVSPRAVRSWPRREDGYTELKFFPALQAGGIPMLKALGGPFNDVSFCPTGRRHDGPMPTSSWPCPNVRCVGGSWLTPADAVSGGDWARITALAGQAAALLRMRG